MIITYLLPPPPLIGANIAPPDSDNVLLEPRNIFTRVGGGGVFLLFNSGLFAEERVPPDPVPRVHAAPHPVDILEEEALLLLPSLQLCSIVPKQSKQQSQSLVQCSLNGP